MIFSLVKNVKNLVIITLLLSTLSIGFINVTAQNSSATTSPDQGFGYIPGELIIIENTNNLEVKSAPSDFTAPQINETPKSLPDTEIIKTKAVTKIVSKSLANRAEKEKQEFKPASVQTTPKIDKETQKTIDELLKEGIKTEPNYTYSKNLVPTDPDFPLQWYLNNTGQLVDRVGGVVGADIKVIPAFDSTVGKSSVKIAVIDDGFDLNHPDLLGAYLPGYDFGDNDNNPDWGGNLNAGHGTKVTGVIASRLNNGISGVGTCPGCKIVPLKVGRGADALLANDAILNAIAWAVNNQIDIINMSFATPFRSLALETALNQATNSGITSIASAGNDGNLIYNYPASFENVISVASTDNRDIISGFSTYNDQVDISAPGLAILTTTVNGGYQAVDGTSFSSPMVAGIAGLMMSINSSLTPAQIKSLIQSNATNISSQNPNFTTFGGVPKSVLRLNATSVTNTPKNTPKIRGVGSLNNDTFKEAIWQNTTSGEPFVNYGSAGGILKKSKSLYPGFNSPQWQIMATTDMDADGITDLVWQNSSNGQPVVWFLNSDGSMKGSRTDYPVPGVDWKIVGTGKMDADQFPDFIWQNKTTSEPYVWYINGDGSLKSYKSLYTGFNAPEWQIMATTDIDNDGIMDLVWQSSLSGQVITWFLNGNGTTKASVLSTTL